MNRPSLPTLTTALAATTILITLTAAAGIEGALAGLLTAAALTLLPPVYAFAIGQVAVGVLAPSRLPELLASPELLGAEAALILGLWSDLTAGTERESVPLLLGGTLGLGIVGLGVYWETESLWLTGGVLTASIVTLAYAIHRYTLVFVLEEAAT